MGGKNEDGSINGPKLYATSPEWDEESFTWLGASDALGEPLGDVGLVPHGSWVEYDVTATVTAGGTYGFTLASESRDGVDFASKEHALEELAPRLLLTVEEPAGTCAALP